MITLKNRNVLITGATGGIGSAVAELLYKEKCNLFLTGTKNSNLRRISQRFGHCPFSEADFSNVATIGYLINKIRRVMKHIDIIINCAGVFLKKPIEKCYVTDYKRVFGINFLAPWLLCREFCPEMKANKWGRIVNLGSIAAYHGHPEQTLYNASKHAILGMTRALHKEFNDYNVRVFCVSPGGTKSRMGEQCVGDKDYSTFLDPKEIAEYIVFNLKFDAELVSTEIHLNRYIER